MSSDDSATPAGPDVEDADGRPRTAGDRTAGDRTAGDRTVVNGAAVDSAADGSLPVDSALDAPDGSAPDAGVPYGSASDDGASDGSVPHDGAPDSSASYDGASDGSAPGDSSSYDRAPGDSSSYDRAPDDSSSYDRAPDDSSSYDRAPDDSSSYDRAPDDSSSYDRAPDDSSSYDRAPDESPADGAAADDAEPARRSSSGSFLRELPFLVVVALGLTVVIRAFLVQAFYIPSASMEQTLLVRDRVLVNKLVYDFREIRRGEVVVFNGLDSFTPETQVLPPGNALERALRFVSTGVGLGAPGEKDFIKRVIGIPGDRVACCTNGNVTVQPEGAEAPVELEEPYLYEDDEMVFCAAGTGAASCPPGAPGVLVPEGRLWVMGDHRSQSSDSRAYIENADSGTVPQDKVIGRAFAVVWPFSRIDVLSVPETFDRVEALPAGVLTSPATPLALGLAGALPLVALRRRRRARAS